MSSPKASQLINERCDWPVFTVLLIPALLTHKMVRIRGQQAYYQRSFNFPIYIEFGTNSSFKDSSFLSLDKNDNLLHDMPVLAILPSSICVSLLRLLHSTRARCLVLEFKCEREACLWIIEGGKALAMICITLAMKVGQRTWKTPLRHWKCNCNNVEDAYVGLLDNGTSGDNENDGPS